MVEDRLLEMAHFIPTKQSACAPIVASLFVQHVFKIHGLPKSIISDRDSKFLGTFGLHCISHLVLLFSSAHHPHTNGEIERTNQILKEIVLHYIQSHLA
eukprot:c43345_g1_i1 orf=314-610(+)